MSTPSDPSGRSALTPTPDQPGGALEERFAAANPPTAAPPGQPGNPVVDPAPTFPAEPASPAPEETAAPADAATNPLVDVTDPSPDQPKMQERTTQIAEPAPPLVFTLNADQPVTVSTATADAGQKVTVSGGDSLVSIAERNGTTAGELYRHNATAIEMAARAAGLDSSHGGAVLGVGLELVIPGKATG